MTLPSGHKAIRPCPPDTRQNDCAGALLTACVCECSQPAGACTAAVHTAKLRFVITSVLPSVAQATSCLTSRNGRGTASRARPSWPPAARALARSEDAGGACARTGRAAAPRLLRVL
eukprot:366297-Chlamydomonas_euryale.AAC.3